MVNFNGTYIDAETIAVVESFDTGDPNYPKGLTVRLKDSATYGVRYSTQKRRDDERYRLINDIYREKNRESEQMMCQLYTVRNTIERIEKRQLRIQKLLKSLNIIPENGSESL